QPQQPVLTCLGGVVDKLNSVFGCYMERLPGCGWCSGNKVCPCCPVRVVCGGRVTVVIAWGKRPVPFRTRKLRLTAPMVLQPGGCGRVGHRRTHFEGEGPNEYAFSAGPGGPSREGVSCWGLHAFNTPTPSPPAGVKFPRYPGRKLLAAVDRDITEDGQRDDAIFECGNRVTLWRDRKQLTCCDLPLAIVSMNDH